MSNMFAAVVQDEEALRSALAEADIAPMLMVLAQLSGDLEILDEVAPHIHGAWSFLESVPEDLKQKVRERLVAVLRDYAASEREPPRHIPSETLQKMMSAGVGQTVPEEYIPLLVEETRLGGEDTRSVHWQRNPEHLPIRNFKVIIIGAGFAGLCAGIRLKELGIPFVILEKNQDVGGTWLENVYPGCAVDTPNHFYSYSFNANDKWSRHFSRRDEILAYIAGTTDKYGLRQDIRFGAEVTTAEFDEPEACWHVTFRTTDGATEAVTGNAVISAVGQLNRPSIPPIAGLPLFHGPVFHTRAVQRSIHDSHTEDRINATEGDAMPTI
jgi:4-hydroxyacetophenone monooxygenase